MYKLLKFRVANYRSFYREQELDLTKTNITALFGANASGKSNLARALSFMKGFILHSANAEILKIPFEPFALRADNQHPTTLAVEFACGEREFNYSFTFTAEAVVEEVLLDLSSQKDKVIFNRRGQTIKNQSTATKFGFTKGLLEKTRPTTLLVTKAREDNNEYANFVFDFLAHFYILSCDSPDLRRVGLDIINRNPNMRHKILRFLRSADLWIRDFAVEETEVSPEQLRRLPATPEGQSVRVITVTTTHAVRDRDNRIVGQTEFSLSAQESAGTQMMFELAPLLLLTLEQGGVLYLDEFGSHLHPDLSKFILQRFQRRHTAQLIVNSHDSSLMEALQRENVILVDKNRSEESLLIPLTDYSPRADDPLERHYRKGLYGGRPLIREVD